MLRVNPVTGLVSLRIYEPSCTRKNSALATRATRRARPSERGAVSSITERDASTTRVYFLLGIDAFVRGGGSELSGLRDRAGREAAGATRLVPFLTVRQAASRFGTGTSTRFITRANGAI